MIFCVHNRASCACALFLAFLNGACACTPCVVLAHANFVAYCIVLGLLQMHFLSMGELIYVWRCWIPVTICGRNFSDNRCPLMCQFRSIRITEIHQCFFY
jgi:hypothetical protein